MRCAFVGVCGGCEREYALLPQAQQIIGRILTAAQISCPLSAAAFSTPAPSTATFSAPSLSIYVSPESGYRARGEFRVFKDYGDSTSPNSQNLPKLSLSMSAKGRNSRVKIPNCPILLPALQRALGAIMPLLERSYVFSHKLYAIEVLGSRFGSRESLESSHDLSAGGGEESCQTIALHHPAFLESPITLHTIAPDRAQCSDVIITLIYHKKLDSLFEQHARALLAELQALLDVASLAQDSALESTPEATQKSQLESKAESVDSRTLCSGDSGGDSHADSRGGSRGDCSLESLAKIHRLTLVARSKNQQLIITQDTSHAPTPASQAIARASRQAQQINLHASHLAHTAPCQAPESSPAISCSLESGPPDSICDVLMLDKPFTYLRQEGRFCQPNAYMNPSMLSFVKQRIHSHTREDLLEMYGGDGNFSIALAGSFRRVLVTEVVKSAHTLQALNAQRNGITNITSVRLSGAETMSALRGEREFFRLRGVDIGGFRFSHVLVDPPRSGIGDPAMLDFLAGFAYIIYISCNPASLESDLHSLARSHTIEHFALFDQFPHTSHKECALILRKT